MDDKYSLHIRENLTQTIQMSLCQKQTIFSEYFFTFIKSILNFEHFQKRMTLTVDVIPKLETKKNLVR